MIAALALLPLCLFQDDSQETQPAEVEDEFVSMVPS